MDLLTYCNIHLNDNNPPCFLADYKTEEILFVNVAMKKLLGDTQDVIGRKFYEVITSRIKPIEPKEGLSWDYRQLTDIEIYSKELKRRFRVKHIPFECNGIEYNLCKYFQLGEESDGMSFEEAMTRCVSILHGEDQEVTPAFLALLGEYYSAEKAYYYRVDKKEGKVTCQQSWVCDDSQTVTQELSHCLDVSVIFEWLDSRNEVGIIEGDSSLKSYSSESNMGQILATFNLDNLVLSTIENKEHDVIAAIVVSNRDGEKTDYRLLQTVAKFIERNITRDVLQDTIDQVNKIDVLTGFYRRQNYVNQIAMFEDEPPKYIGVVYASVNGMRQINAQLGYAMGDSRIKHVADILKEHFQTDFYRISGDEFVAFCPMIEKEAFEQSVIGLQLSMKKANNNSFAIGHGWGWNKYNLAQLIQEANTRMYINKQEFYYHSSAPVEEISDKTLSDLLTYLSNDEFMIYLQPQVELKDYSLHGAEALIRRFDKTNKKMVFPDQFIELYEKKSVIRHVDIFVINQVCRLLSEWRKLNRQIPISVNLSRVTLLEYGIVDTIASICDKYEVPYELLVIEVTERMGLTENDVESSLITEFKDRGFRISLDDFGCAYSNIVTLAQVSVDEVKVDKSLVDHVVTNKKNGVIVKSILSMCNDLEGTSTLSEGIETKEQAEVLRDYNCHLGQGYFFAKPMPVDDFYDKYIKG